MKSRDLISWTYTHHLNRRSSTRITKHGEYYGKVRHTSRYNGPQLAVVQFYGNKRASRVPFDELEEMSTRRKNLIKVQKNICEDF